MNLLVLYKNKYRKIHIGKKGGHYLIINKKKHYLTKNQISELLKNKKKIIKDKTIKQKINKNTENNKKSENKKNKKVLEPNIVISYNLSWRTQEDDIGGSEMKHVQDCINKYGKRAIPYKKLSGCTQRLAKGLYMFNKRNPHNMFDVLCIQEGTKEYTELLFSIINKHSHNKYNYHISKISNKYILGIMYRKIFGKPKEIYKGHFKDYKGRVIQILYFKKINLVIINAHFPHNVRIKSLVKNDILPHISKYIDNSRIIFCGDFNDYHSQLIKGNSAELKLKNLTMKIKNVKKVKSCCYDTIFDSNCDYIFDSKKSRFFGVVPEFNDIELASDHKPILSINNLHVIFK